MAEIGTIERERVRLEPDPGTVGFEDPLAVVDRRIICAVQGNRITAIPSTKGLHAPYRLRAAPRRLERSRTASGRTWCTAPPMPAFYTNPRTLDDVVDQTVARVLDQFDVEVSGVPRWVGEMEVGTD